MARKSEVRDAQKGRARLLETAIRMFSRDGFDGTSVRNVAEEAGVAWSLVRFHFGSKDGLREACEKFVTETYLDIVKSASQTTTNEELDAMIERQSHGMNDIAGFLRRGITEQRPFALEFIRDLLDDMNAMLAADAPETRDEPALNDPIRALSIRLGYIFIAPQIAALLGRDLFSIEELKRRNANVRRYGELLALGLKADRERKGVARRRP